MFLRKNGCVYRSRARAPMVQAFSAFSALVNSSSIRSSISWTYSLPNCIHCRASWFPLHNLMQVCLSVSRWLVILVLLIPCQLNFPQSFCQERSFKGKFLHGPVLFVSVG